MVVLAAVDERANAKQVVTTGLDLVDRRDSRLQVFHVIEESEAKKQVKERDDYFLDTATDDARKTAESIVEAVADDNSNIDVSGHIGDPKEIILDQINRYDPSYLVVGGRKRSPVGKALLGSVLQEILNSASCPVVTVMEQDN